MKRLVLTLSILLGFTLGGVAQSVSFDFEDGTLQGWTVLDADGDGHCWEASIGGMGHNSNGMVMAYSRDYATGNPLTPNEYLVSPRLVLNEWPVINFFVCALDEIYCAEHFGVSISTTVNDDPLAFTLLHDWTLTAKDAGNRQGNWYEFTVDLSAYTGQEVYVAIRHFNCTDMSAICVDDIHIDGEIVQTQHVWRPIGMDGEFLGVSANGNMFTNMGYSGMFRSQDEGETWEHIDVASYVRKETFMINEQDRIFIFDENTYKLLYSDDNGDSWQEQTSGISTNWPLGMFSLSNDTIFICSREKFHWTLDGGESWDETPFDFIGEANFGSILADHAGNVYASTYSWTYPVEQVGIYTATLDDMTHWTVKSSGGASQMAFDSEGYILATGLGSAYFENGIYWVNADRFARTNDDVIFAMKRVDWDNEALFYSTDHGQTYIQCSENIPSTTTAPDPDLGLYKGRDNHLYCHGDVWEPTFVSQYYKSIQEVDFIIESCDAPENFSGQYYETPNGTQYASLLWNPVEGFWYHYDQEPMTGSVNITDITGKWGIKIPADTLNHYLGGYISKIRFYKTGCTEHGGYIHIGTYEGDETAPHTMVWSSYREFEPGPDEWVEISVGVTFDGQQPIWIMAETDSLPAAYCPTAGDPNGRWVGDYYSGYYDYYAQTGQGGDWLIQAFLEPLAKEDNEVDHFNIYRGESLDAMERIAETSKFACYYMDDLTNEPGDYYYRLTASYENGCESAYALDSEHPENDYVLITIPGDMIPAGSEWYYEIQNENGSITYQYLYQAGDTVVQDEPTHILVRINTLYDKDVHTDVTHEYVYERDGKLYWWNKTLEEFTVLYDFNAQVGDVWEIKVGTESLMMHVDAVEEIEYEGRTYRMLHVSDPDDLFSGNIVCGIGHLTSFFPERLMNNGDGIRVEGLRCYWVENELVFKIGDEDCDAVYSEVHGVEEDGPSTPSTGSGALTVYPNPTDGVLFVQTLRATSLHTQMYRITNLMGQTVLSGSITAETQQIDVSNLPKGMYFISIGSETRKFVVQ